MTDDLIARLRDVLHNWTNVTDDEQAVIRDAADALQQQAQEIAAARAWRKCATHGDIDGARQWGCPDCVAQMRREIAALREALRSIANNTCCDRCQEAALVARAALAALRFYAKHEHWMPLAGNMDGPSKLLIANGDTEGVDGWCVADVALAALATPEGP